MVTDAHYIHARLLLLGDVHTPLFFAGIRRSHPTILYIGVAMLVCINVIDTDHTSRDCYIAVQGKAAQVAHYGFPLYESADGNIVLS